MMPNVVRNLMKKKKGGRGREHGAVGAMGPLGPWGCWSYETVEAKG